MLSSYLHSEAISDIADKLSDIVNKTLNVTDTLALFNLCVFGKALQNEEGTRYFNSLVLEFPNIESLLF